MVEKIINLPAQQQLDGEQPRYQPDDDEIALSIADQWKGNARYFHSDWHVYEDGCWQKRDIHELKVSLRKLLRTYRSYGIRVTQRRINGLAQMLEDDLYIPDRKLMDVLEAQKTYINLRNGLYNLETHQLEPHDPDLMFTHQLDFDYDPGADCPMFRHYLRKSLVHPDGKPDVKLGILVQQALAYSMTARTDLKASFWLWGKPDSGKSTFLAFIRGLMGSLHTTIDLNQLSTSKFMLSAIVDKRVVTFSEAESHTTLPDGLYKAMVGGTDEIYADVKNKPGISFRPQAKFWWAMNDAPRVSDRSGATFNRLHIIPFNRSIPPEERILDLDKKLLRERAGIFNELMVFYQRLNNGGGVFERVPQSIAKREQFQMENDTEATFLAECTSALHSSRVGSQELYNRYRNWCDENGFRPKNINQVGKDWERLGLEKRNIDGRFWWQGIVFREN